jgi:hypothetical protein
LKTSLALEGALPVNDHSTTPTVGIWALTSFLLTVSASPPQTSPP